MAGLVKILCVIIYFIGVQCDFNNVNMKMPPVFHRHYRKQFLNHTVSRNEIEMDQYIQQYLLTMYRIPTLLSNLPPDIVTQILTTFSRHEDLNNLNITELVKHYGYNLEEHEVETSDGYILKMFRIPGNGSAVFLMHGLLCSADDWVTAGPDSGIAFLLASQGYDIWLGNARGNKYCRRHKKLSPNSQQFWNFSWDEIGRYDLPAMIDYVLLKTGEPKLKYIGHSQGTTSFFVMCAERPQYNRKISVMIALSAVAWMSHIVSPLVRILSPMNHFFELIAKVVGEAEFIPDNPLIIFLKRNMCATPVLADIICANFMFLVCGFDYNQLNTANLPVIMTHMPSSVATKQLVHYGQGVVSGKFQKFDYGYIKNIEVYGSLAPPSYPVEKITAPVAIFYSDGDWLSSVTDVKILKGKLRNVVEFYKVPLEQFNHLDFIWAKDMKTLILPKLLSLLKMY